MQLAYQHRRTSGGGTVEYIIAVAVSVVSGSLIFLIENLIKENQQLKNAKKDSEKAVSDGVMTLLKIQLIEYHDKYMKDGKIPSYVYDNFDEMYNAYEALGGNGMVKHMKDDIDKLRVGNHSGP